MFRLLILLFAVSCATQKVETPKEVEPSKVVFTTERQEDWVLNLVRVSNCTIALPQLRQDLEAIESFEFTDDSGKDVAAKLKTPAKIRLYTTSKLAPWKYKVLAHAEYGAIKLNTRRNPIHQKYGTPRTVVEIVETVGHEYGHLLGYGHGRNSSHTTGVPNETGLLFKKYAGECL